MKIAIVFLLLSLNSCFTVPVDKKDEPSVPVPKVEPKPDPKVPESVPKPVPKEPEHVPQKPEPVPKKPEPVPQKPEPVPQKPEPVPQKPEPVPQKPEPVPQKPEPVPQKPQPVPQKPQPVPQKPVPKVPQPAPKPVPKMDCLIQLLKKDAPALLQKLGELLCNYRVAQKQQNIANFISFLEQVDTILKQVGCTLSSLLGFNVVITSQDAESLANQVSIILFQFLEDIIDRVVKILQEIPILGDFINDQPLTQDIRDLACGVMEHFLGKIVRILNIVADVTGGLTQIIDGL